ncbi:MAG: tetratricopeptide repeat protein, partial [Candidatus Muiribacteriota bacterium]
IAYNAVSDTVDKGFVRVIFDLSDLEFIDSTGLGFFTGSLKKLKEKNGELKISSPSPYLRRIFNLIHMDYFIEIYEDKSEAIEKLNLKKDDSIKKWEEVVLLNPTYADAHYQLALAYKNNGMFDKSLKEVDFALNINPKYSKAYKLKADVLNLAGASAGASKDALENYQKALKFSPGFIEAFIECAILSGEAKEMHEAEKQLVTILKEKPGYADFNNYLGKIYTALKNPKKALLYFGNALNINPNFTEALINKAKLQAEYEKNHEEAVKTLEHAIKNCKQKYLTDMAKKLINEYKKR